MRVDKSHMYSKTEKGKRKEDRPVRLETDIPRSYTWVANKLAEDPNIGTKVTRQCIEITEKRIFAKMIDAIIADPDLWDYLEDNYIV